MHFRRLAIEGEMAVKAILVGFTVTCLAAFALSWEHLGWTKWHTAASVIVLGAVLAMLAFKYLFAWLES